MWSRLGAWARERLQGVGLCEPLSLSLVRLLVRGDCGRYHQEEQRRGERFYRRCRLDETLGWARAAAASSNGGWAALPPPQRRRPAAAGSSFAPSAAAITSPALQRPHRRVRFPPGKNKRPIQAVRKKESAASSIDPCVGAAHLAPALPSHGLEQPSGSGKSPPVPMHGEMTSYSAHTCAGDGDARAAASAPRTGHGLLHTVQSGRRAPRLLEHVVRKRLDAGVVVLDVDPLRPRPGL